MKRVSAERGFALVEILIALTLVGLIGTLSAGLLGAAWRWADRQSNERIVFERTIGITNTLTTLAEQGSPLVDRRDRPSVAFGTNDALSIASLGPAVLFLARPVTFDVKIVPHHGSLRIDVAWRDARGSHIETLAEDVRSAQFAYFGQRKADRDRRWHATWKQDDGDVEAIRLTLAIADDRDPTEIVAPVRLIVPVDCMLRQLPGCPFNRS